MTWLKSIPTHVWILFCFVLLLVCYYIRPDPVTVDLLKAFSGALLLALRTGSDQRPPSHNENNPASTPTAVSSVVPES